MKYVLLFALLLSQTTLAQTVFTGQVVDAETKEPLAFVNVGIVGRNVGTVTNEQGYFTLPVEEKYNSDTLRASMIGYMNFNSKIADLKVLHTAGIIALKPTKEEIREVEINSSRLKGKVLGSQSTATNFTGSFTTYELGNEVGVRINVGKGTSYLDKFNFNIASTNCDSLLFRVNIYSIDKAGMPDSSLLHENVIVTTTGAGLVTVDLLPYGLEVNDDFIVTIEYIKPCPNRSLSFSAAFLGAIYARQTSQGDWERIKGFDLGFNVRVLR